jgi:hypothetical protein
MLAMESSLDGDPAPQRKTRRDRFLEVAQRRTKALLRDLRLLGNCGNRSAYEYTDGEVEKIFSAIQRELDLARSRFRTEERKEIDFKL